MTSYATVGSITIDSILTSGTYQGLEATESNPIIIGKFENPNPLLGSRLYLNLIIFNKNNPYGSLYNIPEGWINRQNNTWYYAILSDNVPRSMWPLPWRSSGTWKRIGSLSPGQQHFQAATSYTPWPGVSNNAGYIITSNLITHSVYSNPIIPPTIKFSVTKNTLNLYATEEVGADLVWSGGWQARGWPKPKPIWTCQYAIVTWETTNANSTVCTDKNYNLQVSSDSIRGVRNVSLNRRRGLIFLPETYLKKYDKKINNGRKDSEGRTNYMYNIGFIISGPGGTVNASLPFSLWTNGPMTKPLTNGGEPITPEGYFWISKKYISSLG